MGCLWRFSPLSCYFYESSLVFISGVGVPTVAGSVTRGFAYGGSAPSVALADLGKSNEQPFINGQGACASIAAKPEISTSAFPEVERQRLRRTDYIKRQASSDEVKVLSRTGQFHTISSPFHLACPAHPKASTSPASSTRGCQSPIPPNPSGSLHLTHSPTTNLPGRLTS